LIRVAIVLPEYLPVPAVQGGGVETLVNDFIEQNEISGKIEFYIYSLYDEEAKRKAKNFKYTKFYFKKLKKNKLSNLSQRLVRKLFNQTFIFNKNYFIPTLHSIVSKEYDYIVLENKTALLPLVYKMTKDKNTKIVVHIHNFDQIKPNYKVDLSKQCNTIISVSQYVKKNIQRKFPEINSEKIKVVHNFSDISIVEKSSFNDEFRLKNGISKNDRVVLYAGRVIESKGVLDLLNAVKKLNNHNICLLIIGSSWYGTNELSEFEKALRRKSKEVSGKVIFVGYVPHNKMSSYYSVADICVFPSKAPETAGLVQLESMSNKKMTIVSDSGGMPEYIGKSGSIVSLKGNFCNNLSEKLRYVVEMSDAELNRRGEELYEQSKRFSKKNSFNEFSEILEG